MYVCGTSNRLIPPSIVFQPPSPCSAQLFIAFSRGDAISITSILKIDRDHPQRVFPHFSFAFPPSHLFALFTPTSSFAPYSSYSDREPLIARISIGFFFPHPLSLPRFHHVYAATPWPIPRKSIRYARGYRTLLRAVVTSLTLSPGINAQSADFDENNRPTLSFCLPSSASFSLSFSSFLPSSCFR